MKLGLCHLRRELVQAHKGVELDLITALWVLYDLLLVVSLEELRLAFLIGEEVRVAGVNLRGHTLG